MKKILVALCFLNYLTSLECAKIKCNNKLFDTETLSLESDDIPASLIPAMCRFFSRHTSLFKKHHKNIFHFPHYTAVIDVLKKEKSYRTSDRDFLAFLKIQSSLSK